MQRYMEDTSFQGSNPSLLLLVSLTLVKYNVPFTIFMLLDMLVKVEKVISEIGGDMSL